MTDFLTPVGRLVQGSCFKGSTTDMAGKPLTDVSWNPRTQYFIAVAFPKNDPAIDAIINMIRAEARAGFPQLFARDPNGPPTFAWKFTDGDSAVPNRNGTTPNSREGFPGCWVLKFSSGFAFSVFAKGAASVLTDPSSINCGDYIRVAGGCVGNNNPQYPGVYLNARGIELIGYGERIKGEGDAGAAFAAAPVAVPAYVSQTPVASGPPPAAMAPSMMPPAYVPPPTYGAPPAAMAPPAYLQGPPQAPAYTPPPAPAPTRMATINGVDYTEDQLRAAGWTEAQIVNAVVPF